MQNWRVRHLFQLFSFFPLQPIWAVLCDLAQSSAKTGVERLDLDRETNGGVGFGSHGVQYVEELPALADEEPIRGEALDGSDGPSKSIGQRTNDRDMGEFRTDKFARDRKYQAGLNQAGRLQRWIVEKIRKRQAGCGVGKRRHGLLHSIARKINPFEEVSDLVATDAKRDLKDFGICRFLTHG